MRDLLATEFKPDQIDALDALLQRTQERLGLTTLSQALAYLIRRGVRRQWTGASDEERELLKMLAIGDTYRTVGTLRRRPTDLTKYHIPHRLHIRFLDLADMKMVNGEGCKEVPLPYFVVPVEFSLPSSASALSEAGNGRKLMEVARWVQERLGVEFDPLQAILWQFDVTTWAVGFHTPTFQDAGATLLTFHEKLGLEWCYRVSDSFIEIYSLPSLKRRGVADRFVSLEKEAEYSTAERLIHRKQRKTFRRWSKKDLGRLELEWSATASDPTPSES